MTLVNFVPWGFIAPQVDTSIGVQFSTMSEALIPANAATPDFGANSWLVEEMYEQ
ncbi:MAG: hypothetical protein RIS69_1827, partial [Actinomycetota bacterium]